ncbi:SDR family oxidoreductase [Polynucleobacter rarus]|uniref:SDR family oxidoreductase n=1 Tax=Polynucleobacter rarus TaxID=556055 RepID=UPI003182EF5C
MSMHQMKQHFNQPRLLIIGCGDVGQRMLPILVKSHKVYVLTSQTEKLPLFRQAGAHPLFGNLDDQSTLHRLSQIADTVIHLAPPNPNGTTDLRTKSLIQALSKGRRVKRFIYISTTGVYGDCGGQLISETQAVQPQNLRAVRRVDAERQLRAWAIKLGVSVVILRVPGIYAGNRLPVDRLQKGTPALLESEDVFTNHIHADDLARLTILSMYRASSQRVINACDNSDLKMADYFDLVADKMNLPRPPRVDKETLKTLVSPQLLSFMQESRRISNARLQEIGFQFLYPTVQDFLEQL